MGSSVIIHVSVLSVYHSSAVLPFERAKYKLHLCAGKEFKLMLNMYVVQFYTEKSTVGGIVEPVSAWSIRFESTGICSIG